MSIWAVMILGGALTYLTRLSFIWLQDRISMPPLVQRALRFVPPAVLSVVIFQELFYRGEPPGYQPLPIAGCWRGSSLSLLPGAAAARCSPLLRE